MDIGRNLLKIRKFLAPHSKCLFTLVVANSLLFLVSNDILSTTQHEMEIKVALAMVVHSLTKKLALQTCKKTNVFLAKNGNSWRFSP